LEELSKNIKKLNDEKGIQQHTIENQIKIISKHERTINDKDEKNKNKQNEIAIEHDRTMKEKDEENKNKQNKIENQSKFISEQKNEIETQKKIIIEHERDIADEDNKLLIFQYASGILCGNLFFNIITYRQISKIYIYQSNYFLTLPPSHKKNFPLKRKHRKEKTKCGKIIFYMLELSLDS
jgi:hypothetical protein